LAFPKQFVLSQFLLFVLEKSAKSMKSTKKCEKKNEGFPDAECRVTSEASEEPHDVEIGRNEILSLGFIPLLKQSIDGRRDGFNSKLVKVIHLHSFDENEMEHVHVEVVAREIN
jgi:hypothetical protein